MSEPGVKSIVLKRLFANGSYFRNEKRSNDRSVHDRERVANFDFQDLKPGNIKTGGLKGGGQYGNIKSEMQSQRSTGQASFKQEARNLTCADDDEDEDALLINCDLNMLKPQPTNSRPFQMNNNNNNNVNQLKSTNEIYQSFRGANQPSGNIKRPPSTDCISSIFDSYSNRSGMVSKTTTTASVLTKKPKIEMMAIDDKDDDDDDFETDFRAIKAAASVESAAAMSHSSSRSSNISTKSSSSDRIQGNQAAVKSRPNVDQFKQQLAEKEDSPINISSLLELQENCCLFNVPDPSGDEPGALATCEHEIRCQVKTLTAQLKQVKLKWHQECILADDTNDSLAAYISDEPMSQLLEMTCAQAKELFIKSRQQSQNPQSKPTEDYNTIFTRRRKNCEEVLKNNTFLMRLSYDFPRGNYCVVKLTKL